MTHKLTNELDDLANKLELFAIDIGWISHAQTLRTVIYDKEYDDIYQKPILDEIRKEYIKYNKQCNG